MEMENGVVSRWLATVVVGRLRLVMIIVQNSVMIDIGVHGQHVRGISGVLAIFGVLATRASRDGARFGWERQRAVAFIQDDAERAMNVGDHEGEK